MKEITSDCHLNEKRRPLKVADSRRKTRTKQSRKNERRVSAQSKPRISRKRREKKSAGSLKRVVPRILTSRNKE